MFFKQSRNNVSTLMEVVVGSQMSVVPLPPLCSSAPALRHSHTKANVTFVGGLLFSKMTYLGTERQERLRQPTAEVQRWTQRQQPAPTPGSTHTLAAALAGQSGWGRQQCYLEIAIFAIAAQIFQVLPAHCTGVSVDALQRAMSK